MDDLYLERFVFPSEGQEVDFFLSMRQRIHESYYPFQVLRRQFGLELDFEPVTILYGGNGSGKSTALNVIAETLHIQREAPFNHTPFFEDYCHLCHYRKGYPYRKEDFPPTSRMIASDDVFDYALTVRDVNDHLNKARTELRATYTENKYAQFRMRSLEDYDQLRAVNQARRKTQSRYLKDNLMDNARTHSNGENGFRYFTQRLDLPGLYLLDEPENSLSPMRQLELAKYIEDSVRAADCQIIMATHSPFMLAIPGAKIYDLDSEPIQLRDWTELEAVRAYWDFFKAHATQLEENRNLSGRGQVWP